MLGRRGSLPPLPCWAARLSAQLREAGPARAGLAGEPRGTREWAMPLISDHVAFGMSQSTPPLTNGETKAGGGRALLSAPVSGSLCQDLNKGLCLSPLKHC